eukprot:gene11909-8191_t
MAAPTTPMMIKIIIIIICIELHCEKSNRSGYRRGREKMEVVVPVLPGLLWTLEELITTTKKFQMSARRPEWMSVGPEEVSCPAFSWYTPTYLIPGNHGDRTVFFPPILEALLHPQPNPPTAASPSPSPVDLQRPLTRRRVEEATTAALSDPFNAEARGAAVMAELEASVEAQAERRRALNLDWRHPTPIEEIWDGPPINAKVPPANDYTRLLASVAAGRRSTPPHLPFNPSAVLPWVNVTLNKEKLQLLLLSSDSIIYLFIFPFRSPCYVCCLSLYSLSTARLLFTTPKTTEVWNCDTEREALKTSSTQQAVIISKKRDPTNLFMSYEAQYGKVPLPAPETAAFPKPEASTSASPEGTAAAGPQKLTHDVHGRPVPHGASAAPPGTTRCAAAVPSLYTPFQKMQTSSPALSRAFMQWYTEEAGHLCAVTTADFFLRQTQPANPTAPRDTSEEYVLWSLCGTLLQDAERAVSLHPEVLGLEKMQPHRRWFISHYAHIQYLLMRQPVLRIANTICLWLEQVYRDSHPADPRLKSTEEPIVLRQLLLTYLRGGELYKAIDAAATCRDCAYSCLLSAAQLQTVEEPWMSETRVVPLFGEYAHGNLAQSWTGNQHRLATLSQLFDDASKHAYADENEEFIPSAQLSFEAVIGAALCGHHHVLESAFCSNGHERWQDVVWSYLRCSLVVAFTKQLMCAGHAVEPRYAAYVESFTGTQDGWEERFTEQLVKGLVDRLRGFSLLNESAPTASVLQLRVVLQALAGTHNSQSAWLKCLAPTPGNGHEARRLTHLYLLLDTAYRESLMQHAVQVHACEEVCAALCQHVSHLALLPLQQPGLYAQQGDAGDGKPRPSGHVDTMRGVMALTLRLQDVLHRAHVYAAFLIAVREVELERGERTRAEVEEEECQMTRLFLEADKDPQSLRREVMRVLDQKVVAPDDLLTHDKTTERLLWEAMHSQSGEDFEVVARRCLELAHNYWCAAAHSPPPPSGATLQEEVVDFNMHIMMDINQILQLRVLPFLLPLAQDRGDAEWTRRIMTHAAAADFWRAFTESYSLSVEHAKIAGELGMVVAARSQNAAGGSELETTAADRTLRFRLSQEEGALLLRLVQVTKEGTASVHDVLTHQTSTHRVVASAAAYMVQQLTENVILSFLAHPYDNNIVDVSQVLQEDEEGREASCPLKSSHDRCGPEEDGGGGPLSLLQAVFCLVEQLDEAGYIGVETLPQALAQALFTKVRTMRVTYGQRLHSKKIREMLQQRDREL